MLANLILFFEKVTFFKKNNFCQLWSIISKKAKVTLVSNFEWTIFKAWFGFPKRKFWFILHTFWDIWRQSWRKSERVWSAAARICPEGVRTANGLKNVTVWSSKASHRWITSFLFFFIKFYQKKSIFFFTFFV